MMDNRADNLAVYNSVRDVPYEAQKKITGGRLKGMTDINPMWRIKTLTEQFGMAGVGWYYTVNRHWAETGADGAVTANIEISLYIKHKDEWSAPIQGIGGSMLIAKENTGLYTDDECYKKALTDALSVCCKALGIGADIYWSSDASKYAASPVAAAAPSIVCSKCSRVIEPYQGKSGKTISAQDFAQATKQKFGAALCAQCIPKV